jgi:hypothetical protein
LRALIAEKSPVRVAVEGDIDGDTNADFRIQVDAPPLSLHDYAFVL